MTPLINASLEASKKNQAMSDEQFAFFKEQYGKDSAINKQVVDAALERTKKADEWATADRERYKSVFQPMEDSLVKEATEYNTEGRREQEAGKASASVAEAFEANRRAAAQNLESFGVDPSATRYAALDAGSRLAQAAAAAGAANKARNDTEETARRLRSEAIQVGQNYPGYVTAGQGTAIQSGNAGINSQLATTGSGAATTGTAPQWGGLAAQNLGAAGNMTIGGYDAAMRGFDASEKQSSGFGSLLGTVAGAALPLLFEEGGAIPDAASPTGGMAIDDVPAQLTAGEFVIPKDVLSWKGEEFFQKLIEGSRKAKPQAPAQPEAAIPTGGQRPPPTFVSRPQAIPMGA
jgi:hypothetical protein